MLLWEAQAAESSFELNQSLSNRSRYLSALENLVGPICMPNLFSTLKHDKPSEDSNCQLYLEKLLNLDEANPIGICARDGIDSSTCQTVNDGQIVETYKIRSDLYDDANDDKAELDLAFKLDQERNKDSAMKSMQSVMQIINSMPATPSPEALSKYQQDLRGAMQKLLRQSCKMSRVHFEKGVDRRFATPPTRTSLKAQEKASQTKKLLDELQKLSGDDAPPTPSPTPKKDSLVRVRYISEMCSAAIAQVLGRDNHIALTTCFKFGFYSKDCVTALRQEKQFLAALPKPQANGTPDPNAHKPFEEF